MGGRALGTRSGTRLQSTRCDAGLSWRYAAEALQAVEGGGGSDPADESVYSTGAGGGEVLCGAAPEHRR